MRPAYRFAVLSVLAFGLLLLAFDLFRSGFLAAAFGLPIVAGAGGLLAARAFRVQQKRLAKLNDRISHAERSAEKMSARLAREVTRESTALHEDVQARTDALADLVLGADVPKRRVHARGLPLVLISQVPRSGGTLLSQLFDGHPDLLTFPYEMKWGGKPKFAWPDVQPLDGASQVANRLITHNLRNNRQFNLSGYDKASRADESAAYPHRWSYWRYLETFLDAWSESPPSSRRDCLDIFTGAYFSAYADWRNVEREKKSAVAFTAGAFEMDDDAMVAGFFDDYPDGVFVRLCRNPADWYASASNHKESYKDLDKAMVHWELSARAGCALKDAHGDRVLLIDFASLIGRTRDVMALLADRIGVPFDPSMLTPSFNGWATRSNSSFARRGGIDRSVLDRSQILPDEVRAQIDAGWSELHREFVQRADI